MMPAEDRAADHGTLRHARPISCPTMRMVCLVQQQEIDMGCEVELLSDIELDAVTGGMMNSAHGNFLPKPPIKGGPVHSIAGVILEDPAV